MSFHNKLQKKAQKSVTLSVEVLIGVLVFLLLLTELAPIMFTNISGMDTTVVPEWLPTLLTVIVASALILMVWKRAHNK